MTAAYPHLFEPMRLRHLMLNNRIVFGAHTANMAEEGIPGDRHFGYYRERARGGAGMIVVEPVPVHRTAVLTRGNFLHDTDEIVPHFRRITEEVKSHGTAIIQQLYHVGAHGDWDSSFSENWSPSGLPSMFNSDGSHAMTDGQVEEVIEGHVSAARRAHDAGFDGIEIMAAYSALMEQFWSPFTNRRVDRWGGSFENRMRFSQEVYSRIRKACGDDFVCGVAVAIDPGAEVVQSIEMLQEVMAWHDERALVDYVTLGRGSYWGFTRIIPTAFEQAMKGEEYAGRLKSVCRHIRVQCEARVTAPENGERIIASGMADMVSIVRGQIADPQLANKSKAGRASEIRPCIGCNQQCIGRRHRDYWISCMVNPSTGREAKWGGDNCGVSDNPRAVLIVGGGPAGMEAARVAAERGHGVRLVEATEHLGGQWRLASLQPRRNELADHLAWLERELDRLGVAIDVGIEMDAEMVRDMGVDDIIVATGSHPPLTGYQRALPERDGLDDLDKGQVCAINQVLDGTVTPGERVLLLDDIGFWPGNGTALLLAEAGHQVTVVAKDAAIAAPMGRVQSDKAMRKALAMAGAELRPQSAVVAWTGETATIRHQPSGAEETRPFDSLVICETPVANDALWRDLEGSGLRVRPVGDCVAYQMASGAFYDARRTAMEI
ncbi:MAG: oxidoreductase [Rhodospirillaceae bacterium]|nr:oxidoreductase [Rhodospirillaceae bacterium]